MTSLDTISKNIELSNSMKIRPVAIELFHAEEQRDNQTDMKKLKFFFRNFMNAPTKGQQILKSRRTYFTNAFFTSKNFVVLQGIIYAYKKRMAFIALIFKNRPFQTELGTDFLHRITTEYNKRGNVHVTQN